MLPPQGGSLQNLESRGVDFLAALEGHQQYCTFTMHLLVGESLNLALVSPLLLRLCFCLGIERGELFTPWGRSC